MADTGMEKRLTPKQKKTIFALLSTKNITSAAAKVGVGERTIYRWMGDPSFKAGLLSAEGEIIDQATRRLLTLHDQAINVFDQIMSNDACSPGTKLRAAQSILDYLLKLRELRNLESRLAALEEKVNNRSEE